MVAQPLKISTWNDDMRGAASSLAASAGADRGSPLQGNPACALAQLARRLWASSGPGARSGAAAATLGVVRGLLRHALPALATEEQRALAADAFQVTQVWQPYGQDSNARFLCHCCVKFLLNASDQCRLLAIDVFWNSCCTARQPVRDASSPLAVLFSLAALPVSMHLTLFYDMNEQDLFCPRQKSDRSWGLIWHLKCH